MTARVVTRPAPVWTSALLLALLAAVALAAPQFPPLTGRVVDRAGLLSPEQVKTLTDKLAAHEAATTNQVVVVTVEDLQGYPIEDYGYQLGRHWGIGQEGKDNGVLLIVAPEERKVRIEVGYGLEGTLTDALSKVIIEREIVPRFKRGDMAGGIVAGTDAILQALGGEYVPPERAPGEGAEEGFPLPAVFIFALMIAGALRRIMHPGVVAGLLGGGATALAIGLTGQVLPALVIGVFLFLFLWVWLSNWGSGGFYTGGGGGRSWGGGGGGFSGGGGSFGGGGASGSW
jgi:uncharacterized protein